MIAIGNPYGRQFDHTVTIGVLSAKGREIGLSTPMDQQDYKNLMQTDAINAATPAARLNIKGEVIGINAAVHAKLRESASPSINVAKEVLQELIETGSVQRAWLGIEYLVIPTISKGITVCRTRRCYRRRSARWNTGCRSGIRAGDVIRGSTTLIS